MTIYDDYLDYQEKYVEKYGDKTIVFMQVGGFHEAYATDNRGYDLFKLSEILDMICTRKNKKKDKVDESNPYMMGFPSFALNKYTDILVSLGFTVIVVDQTTLASKKKKPKREVTQIVSAGTYIDGAKNFNYNYIVALYISDEMQRTGKLLTGIGMSAIDITTGKTVTHDAYSSSLDDHYAVDEAVRFIICHAPKEIIIYRKIHEQSISEQKLVEYLELGEIPYKYYDEIPKHYKKLSYQKEFLAKIYPDHGMLTPIEYLNMERNPYVLISFISALDYAFQYNENIVKKVLEPIDFAENKHLVLGNNAIYQLNILDNKLQQGNTRYRCLFDVVNKTSTAIGRRFLKDAITAPLISKKQIEERYDVADALIKRNRYVIYEKYLKLIPDIERLHRKLLLGVIHPYDLVKLIESCQPIKVILKMAHKHELNKIIPKGKMIKQIKELVEHCDKLFDMDEMKKHNTNITESFYNIGNYPEIDNLQEQINESMLFMENICTTLARYIDGPTTKYPKIILKNNESEGYYLITSVNRVRSLKSNIKKIQKINVTDNKIISHDTFTYKTLKNQVKIYIPELSNMSNSMQLLKEQLVELARDTYIKDLQDISAKYGKLFAKLSKFIAVIDFAKSNAKTAKLYNYTRPNVKDDQTSFIKCVAIRHPIAERINEDIEYIANDVNLGIDISGMLIYGLNSSGKSTLMKAMGLSVVLAQAGMFVPAKKFTISPYRSLFTRITGDDNILKGLSSFALEMTELRAILRRAGSKTLVIGDEVCRGTEHISGNALVAATIVRLANTGSNFMFATHLHEIAEMKQIQKLKNVRPYHLVVDYDEENDLLIFDRKLKEGPGEKVYGIKVARFIIDDTDFIKLAQQIKNEIIDQPNKLLMTTQSKYNKDVYVDSCMICGTKADPNSEYNNNLDTHHINFQKDCKDGFVKDKTHIKKNGKGNLIVLCKKCHHDVHHGKLVINGYVSTSKGRKVKTKLKDKKKSETKKA